MTHDEAEETMNTIQKHFGSDVIDTQVLLDLANVCKHLLDRVKKLEDETLKKSDVAN